MDKKLNKRIGLRIVLYRARHRLSQEQLAKDVGVSRGFISDLERGAKSVSVETLARLSDATGLTPNMLMGS